jgi:DNA (cytosine-5)-methyltransferase 1
LKVKNNNNKPTFISLFSGCGGFDLGFKEAGFESLGAFDIDSLCLDNLHENIGSPIYEYDLSSGALPAEFHGSPDVILSGSPCQGFSTIGKRDVEDPRNSLLISGASIALKLNPKIFLAENVPGVISGKHKKYWEKLKSMMIASGYRIQELKVNTYDYGVPQVRKRIFLFAWNTNVEFGSLPMVARKTLKDALKNIRGKKNHLIESLSKESKDYLIANRIKQGQKLSNVRGGERSIHTWDIPEVFGAVTIKEEELLVELISLRRKMRLRDFGDADPVERSLLESLFGKDTVSSLVQKNYLKEIGDRIDIVGGFNGKFRRLSLNAPSYTVDTRFGNARNFLHPTQNRGFSVREAARIQGFSDSYSFSGPRAEQYRMIGNAVPPPMSYALGKFIRENLLRC